MYLRRRASTARFSKFFKRPSILEVVVNCAQIFGDVVLAQDILRFEAVETECLSESNVSELPAPIKRDKKCLLRLSVQVLKIVAEVLLHVRRKLKAHGHMASPRLSLAQCGSPANNPYTAIYRAVQFGLPSRSFRRNRFTRPAFSGNNAWPNDQHISNVSANRTLDSASFRTRGNSNSK